MVEKEITRHDRTEEEMRRPNMTWPNMTWREMGLLRDMTRRSCRYLTQPDMTALYSLARSDD